MNLIISEIVKEYIENYDKPLFFSGKPIPRIKYTSEEIETW